MSYALITAAGWGLAAPSLGLAAWSARGWRRHRYFNVAGLPQVLQFVPAVFLCLLRHGKVEIARCRLRNAAFRE